ncbi:MAG: DUF4190 domain-containing protein [Flavobacteriales bacterium]|nr:DUF4190 domain-containing protein [Flavobacteriales bacterium]
MENQQINTQQNLPNSTGVLVLGILSIVFCFCYGLVGMVLGIIAIVLGKKANKLYNDNPNTYSESSYKNMKAGKVCGIIGLCLSSLYLIVIIIYISIVGAALTAMPWAEMMNQY